MKKWIALPCILLLAVALAAQTDSSAPDETTPTEAPAPVVTPQNQAPAPTPMAQSALPVPAGTALMVRLDTTLATFSNRVGDQFQGSLTQPVVLNGQTMIPAGATASGAS